MALAHHRDPLRRPLSTRQRRPILQSPADLPAVVPSFDNPYQLDADGLHQIGATPQEQAHFSQQAPATVRCCLDAPAVILRYAQHERHGQVARAFPRVPGWRRKALRDEVNAVVVRPVGGAPQTLRQAIRAAPMLVGSQRQALTDLIIELRHAWTTRARSAHDDSYDDVNWQHACVELAQILSLGVRAQQSGESVFVACVASLLSDAAKFRGNFLVHHIDGAIAATIVLPRIMSITSEVAQTQLAWVIQCILEHQIGPPAFMANMIRLALLRDGVADADPALCTLVDKIAHPLERAHHRHALGHTELLLSDEERAHLMRVGLDGWYVPDPRTPWFEASRAVIDADSLVNYVSPDGVGKIVAITGPGTPFFAETVFAAMASCGTSFVDAATVMSPIALAEVVGALPITRAVLNALREELDLQLRDGALRLSADAFERIMREENVDGSLLSARLACDAVWVDIPTSQRGQIPSWNRPLHRDETGAPVEFAKLLRRAVADRLRGFSTLR